MNIIAVVKPAVVSVVHSEGAKAVVGFCKPIVKAGLKGIQRGAIVGAGFVTFGYGAKLATKGMPKLLDPIVQVIDIMGAGKTPMVTLNVNIPENEKEAEQPEEQTSEIEVQDKPAEDQE